MPPTQPPSAAPFWKNGICSSNSNAKRHFCRQTGTRDLSTEKREIAFGGKNKEGQFEMNWPSLLTTIRGSYFALGTTMTTLPLLLGGAGAGGQGRGRVTPAEDFTVVALRDPLLEIFIFSSSPLVRLSKFNAGCIIVGLASTGKCVEHRFVCLL